jgi:hypothetical protein
MMRKGKKSKEETERKEEKTWMRWHETYINDYCIRFHILLMIHFSFELLMQGRDKIIQKYLERNCVAWFVSCHRRWSRGGLNLGLRCWGWKVRGKSHRIDGTSSQGKRSKQSGLNACLGIDFPAWYPVPPLPESTECATAVFTSVDYIDQGNSNRQVPDAGASRVHANRKWLFQWFATRQTDSNQRETKHSSPTSWNTPRDADWSQCMNNPVRCMQTIVPWRQWISHWTNRHDEDARTQEEHQDSPLVLVESPWWKPEIFVESRVRARFEKNWTRDIIIASRNQKCMAHHRFVIPKSSSRSCSGSFSSCDMGIGSNGTCRLWLSNRWV